VKNAELMVMFKDKITVCYSWNVQVVTIVGKLVQKYVISAISQMVFLLQGYALVVIRRAITIGE
jgi:hypothetical protein